jgi:hypothetical protein
LKRFLGKPERGKVSGKTWGREETPLRRKAQRGHGPCGSITAKAGKRSAAGRKALKWGKSEDGLEPQSPQEGSE